MFRFQQFIFCFCWILAEEFDFSIDFRQLDVQLRLDFSWAVVFHLVLILVMGNWKCSCGQISYGKWFIIFFKSWKVLALVYVLVMFRFQLGLWFMFNFCCISAEEFDSSLDFGRLDVWL